MISALNRFAWRQLSRHRGRTALTIATLAAAVIGVWLFAAPRDFDAAMNERVESDILHDAILRPDGVLVDDTGLTAMRAVSNVDALDVRATHITEMQVGDRIQDVWLVGVRDFDDQRVNVISVDAGERPEVEGTIHQALTDPVNARGARGAGDIGDTVLIRNSRGRFEQLSITGEGTSVHLSHEASEWITVLYVPIEVVWDLAPFDDVFTQIEYRVEDRNEVILAEATDSIREKLAELKPTVQYNALVEVRPADEWPGEDDFDNFLVLFWVIAGVSVASAFVLVSSTMATFMREQARAIGVMKSIGGRRRQILATYLSTAAFLGVGGTLVGTAIGLPLANLLTNYLGGFQGVEIGWRVSGLALALSVAVGVGVTVLASLPPLLRGTRITVQEAFGQSTTDAAFGMSRVDRLVTRVHWLPRTAQLGLRGAGRRKLRGIATHLQIALAVGTLLGFTSLAITIIEVSEQSRSAEGGDIELYNFGGGRSLDRGATDRVAAINGVDRVQPIIGADLLVGDTDTFTWGLPAEPVFAYDLDEGRWFTAAENERAEPVAVVGPALATLYDIEVGESVRAETVLGPTTFEVVGIDTTLVGDGLAVFIPIETALDVTDRTRPTWFWITTTSADTNDIDRVATEIRQTLDPQGYGYKTDVRYIERAADRQEDRTIIAIILSLGIPIVAMGMIGLASAMTTNILERTREIGVMRSIGARARDIRRVFLAEAVVLVVLGWITGIAVGYVIGQIILRTMSDAFNVSFTLRYPLWPIAVALIVALLVAVAVLRRPLRRAGQLSPSVALRYE